MYLHVILIINLCRSRFSLEERKVHVRGAKGGRDGMRINADCNERSLVTDRIQLNVTTLCIKIRKSVLT